MAKRSNKTAHVLNLLAGHDTAKEAEEPSSVDGELSDKEAGQAPPSAPAEQEPDDKEKEAAAVSPGVSAPQQNAAPAKAPVSSPNNISLIDKTGEDPVADLIQEKLSSEFEKQIQESHAGSPDAEQTSVDSDLNSTEEETDFSAADSIGSETAVSKAGSVDNEAGISERGSVDNEAGISQADSVDNEAGISQADSVDNEAGISQADSVDNEAGISEAGSVDNEAGMSEAGSIDDNATVSNASSIEAEGADSEENPMENKETASAPISAGTSSEEPSNLQEALDLNSGEKTSSLSETDEELETTSESGTDSKAEPESTEQAASAPLPAAEPEPEPDFAAVNVMEHIVNDKIIYFMRQFDVCTCDRCKADVIALTLNGLMPKYIVTMPSAVDPLLSYYTNRLISDVTVEATKACMTVKDNPRH